MLSYGNENISSPVTCYVMKSFCRHWLVMAAKSPLPCYGEENISLSLAAYGEENIRHRLLVIATKAFRHH